MHNMDPELFMTLMESGSFATVVGDEKAVKLEGFIKSQASTGVAIVHMTIPSSVGKWSMWIVYHVSYTGPDTYNYHIGQIYKIDKGITPMPKALKGKPFYAADMIEYEEDPVDVQLRRLRNQDSGSGN